MADNNGDKLMGMKEICAHLRISESTALNWYRTCSLPIKKAGGIWIGSRHKIDKWYRKFSG